MEDFDRSLEEDTTALGNADKVKYAFKLYGSIAAILFAIFILARPRFPAVYNVRNTIPAFNCELASEIHGHFGWIRKVLFVSDDALVEQCGIDSAGIIRMITLGMRMSIVGIFNAAYLIPVYKTAEDGDLNVTDGWDAMSLSNVPLGSDRLYATLVAAYVFFTCAMIFVAREVKWFTIQRTRLLSEPEPQNYSVYIQDVTKELRSNEKLGSFFRSLLGEDQVVAATFPLDIPNLEKLVARRNDLQDRRNGAIKVLDGIKNGEDPPKDCCCMSFETFDDAKVEALTDKLVRVNHDIERAISKIEAIRAGVNDEAHVNLEEGGTSSASKMNSEEILREDGKAKNETAQGKGVMPGSLQIDNITKKMTKSGVADVIAENNPMEVAIDVIPLVSLEEDGGMKDAAFVTFSSLRSTMITLQLKHNTHPWTMKPIQAPKPRDVIWHDVRGPRNKKRIGLGMLGSRFGTTFALTLYAGPVFFIATLFEAGSLADTFPSFGRWLESSPWVEMFLAQVAPLLLICLFYVAWGVLELLGRREGLVGQAMLRSSLCWKLITFQVIQNFLVLLFAGAGLSVYEVARENPDNYGKLLSTAIPAASSIFMQFIATQVFLSIGFEVLRLGPILVAVIQRFTLPYLETGQYNPWLGIFPLSSPPDPSLSFRTSYIVLQILSLSAFSTISPVVACIQAFIFLFLNVVYRHQCIYVYPAESLRRVDTAGEYWVAGTKAIIICIILSEMLLSSVLGLKEGTVAAGLLIPLILFSIIFAFPMYILIGLSNFVPSDSLVNDDSLSNESKAEEWKSVYTQPALARSLPMQANIQGNVTEPISSTKSEKPAGEEGVELSVENKKK